MIFNKTLVDTDTSPGAGVIEFSVKSVAFNSTHNVYVDIFALPSTLSRKESLDHQNEHTGIQEIWVVRNYFEVTTFDENCYFLWGETINDENSENSIFTVTEYESIFNLIEQKTSMIHRKMQQELKSKITKNSNVKI